MQPTVHERTEAAARGEGSSIVRTSCLDGKGEILVEMIWLHEMQGARKENFVNLAAEHFSIPRTKPQTQTQVAGPWQQLKVSSVVVSASQGGA